MTGGLETAPDDVGHLLLTNNVVVEAEFNGPDFIEAHATRSGLDDRLRRITKDTTGSLVVRIAVDDLLIQFHTAFADGEFNFRRIIEERHTRRFFLLLGFVLTRDFTEVSQRETTQRNVLRRRVHGLAAGWREQVVRSQHHEASFHLCFHRERNVNSHLVTVEVSVVSCANKGVNADSFTFDELRFKGLNGETVKSRCTVEKHWVTLGDFIKNIPHFRGAAFDHLLRATHGVNEAKLFQAADDERLKQDKSHLLWKTALTQGQIRTDNDNGTTGVIDALTEQVLTETTGLALKHVGHGLERTIASASHRTTVTTVVEQGIHSFLQHALFVTDDDIRSLEREEVLETVVTVDDATVKVVQIGSRKAATFKRNERTKVWWNNWEHFQHHVFRA